MIIHDLTTRSVDLPTSKIGGLAIFVSSIYLKQKHMKSQKVWFVTGASKGLGLNLVKELLAQDYSVVATTRTKQALENEIGDQENFLPLEVDITDDSDVA
ncbi:MAG: SDR family NAD(P)-dependent oxidoreductase, partial [Sphingobacterium sp.]